MRFWINIFSLLLLWSCSYNGFNADEWGGGLNELRIDVSKGTVTFSSHEKTRDTLFVTTNGERWDFTLDSLAPWCRARQLNSLLIIMLDSNTTTQSRVALLKVNAYYNNVKIVREVPIIQPGKEVLVFPSPSEEHGFSVPFDHEIILDMEWSPVPNKLYWTMSDSLVNAIGDKLQYYCGSAMDLEPHIKDRLISIKGFDIDRTLSKNIFNDRSADVGFWFSADGMVSTALEGTLCWDFIDKEPYCDYVSMVIYLNGSVKNVDQQCVAYYAFVSEDETFILKLILNVHKSLPSRITTVQNLTCYTLLKCNGNFKLNSDYTFQIDTVVSLLGDDFSFIKTKLGGVPDKCYVSLGGVDEDFQWVDGESCGWWISENGVDIAPFGEETKRLWLEPVEEGAFNLSCNSVTIDKESFPYSGDIYRARYYFVNSATLLGVEVRMEISLIYGDNPPLKSKRSVIYNIPYLPNYATVTNVINDTVWIEALKDVGGSVDLILLGDKGKLPCKFEPWNSNGGWFGKDGAEEWGNENSLFCIEFDDSGVIKDACSRSRIYSIETFPLQANGVFRFINLKRNLVSDVYVTVNIYNNEQL